MTPWWPTPVEPLALKGKAEPVDAFRLVEVGQVILGVARRLDTRDGRTCARARCAPRSARSRHTGSLVRARHDPRRTRRREVTADPRVPCRSSGRVRHRARPVLVLRRRHHLLARRGDAHRRRGGRRHRTAPPRSDRRSRALLRETNDATIASERLAEFLGLAGATASPEETHWAIRKLFETLAAERPLVALFEDIHWAEPGLLDLIEHVAEWTRDAPILLVCPARPELPDVRPGWGGQAAAIDAPPRTALPRRIPTC